MSARFAFRPAVSLHVAVCGIGLIAACWIGLGCGNGPTTGSGNGGTGGTETPPPAKPAPAKLDYAALLVEAGWDRDAAGAVAALNAEWFEIQADENPNGLERQLKLLKDLGQRPELQPFLAEHPETAGLLAQVDDPNRVAESLGSGDDDYPFVAGLYVQHAAPSDADELAAALERNRDRIVALQRKGVLGCEALFLFDRQNPSVKEYEAWLWEVIEPKLEASDEVLASFIHLVLRHGGKIRQRLRDDAAFRSRFRGDLWPRLTRAVGGEHGMFELFVDEERIWDVLALDNGEELVKQCGLLPVDLLFGYPEIGHAPYPRKLHGRIAQVLLGRKEQTIHALMKFRDEPQFHRLLARDLPSDTLSAALAQLFAAGPNYPARLALYEGLSATALADEVGPPPEGLITWIPFYYTVYEVPKKLLQGREPTGMEWFSAAVDPVFLIVDIASAGGTAAPRKALLVGTKETAEAATKKLVEKGAEKVTEKGGEKALVTTLRNTGLELAGKQLGKEAAEKLGEKELLKWSVTGILSETSQVVKNALGKATTFEITKPLQFVFQHGGVGREAVKRWTGLEARHFMRGDARVFVRLTKLPAAVAGSFVSRTAIFLERTAQDLTLGTAVESDAGQKILGEGAQRVLSAAEELEAWRKNVSAWWLLNAGGGMSNTQSQGKAE